MSLLAAVVAGGAPLPTPHTVRPPDAASSVSGAVLQGKLEIIWIDGKQDVPSYAVVSPDGARTPVSIDDSTMAAAGGLTRLVGQTVRVSFGATDHVAGALFKANAVQVTHASTLESPHTGSPTENPGYYYPQFGSKPFVMILARFADSTGITPAPLTYYQGLLGAQNSVYPSINNYWSEQSYGNVDFAGSTVIGWVNLPYPQSHYIDATQPQGIDYASLFQDAATAVGSGTNFTQYYGISLMLNTNLNLPPVVGDYGGLGSAATQLTINGVTQDWATNLANASAENSSVMCHEFGHSLGLLHSSGPYGAVYDSEWDVMSADHLSIVDPTYGTVPMGTVSYQKSELGWVSAARTYVPTPGSSQTFNIERLDNPVSSANYLMAKIPTADGSLFYTVEARQFAGYDQSGSLPGECVLMHTVDPTRAQPAHVVDPNTNNNPNDAGAMWTPGKTFTDASNGITVQVNSKGTSSYNVTISLAANAPVASVVTNTSDSGAGSLRNALLEASNFPGTTITFNIPIADPNYNGTTHVFTITPATALPDVAGDDTVIDGSTEAAFAGTANAIGPDIAIVGSSSILDGLAVTASDCVIKDIAIEGFANDGILLYGTDAGFNTITGCYCGVDPTGLIASGQSFSGIYISTGAHDNVIGGTTAAARNLLSGTAGYGLAIGQTGTQNNRALGNWIGTDETGEAALPNADGGVGIFDGATGNTIGGIGSGVGNVISGNSNAGISIFGTGATGNLVQGNLIGVDPSGDVALQDGASGVFIAQGASGNIIGGPTFGAGNVISGNSGGSEVQIGDAGSNNNVVEGNLIGLGKDGVTALGCAYAAVYLYSGAQDNQIGAIGAENQIFNSAEQGVAVGDPTTIGNSIRGNSIDTNIGLGIDLLATTDTGYGVTPNHTGTASGPNDLQNYPVLSSAILSGSATTVTGTFNSLPSATYTLDFYSSPAAHPSGYGEGRTYLGSKSVTTDVNGNAPVSVTLGSAAGVITSTATSSSGDTSEFSAAVAVTSATNPAPTITSISPSTLPVGSGPFTLTVTGTGFIASSQISFDGFPQTTTLNNNGALSATISSLPILPGPVSVTVTNQSPGGGTSSAATFTVTTATNPSPAITNLSPSTLPEGSGSFTLTVSGTGFVSTSQIDFGGQMLATSLQLNGTLTATVGSLPDVTGPVAVTVVNPAPGGGTSPSATFTIGPANNPSPVISSLSPSTLLVGSPSFTLTVTGTGFIASSQISFNGALLITTLNNNGTLSAVVPALPGTAGSLPVTVTNPTPGGGTSTAVDFVVAPNPLAVISSLSPSSLPEGNGSFTLTVTGTGFIPTSQISFGGQLLTTTLEVDGTLTGAVASLPNVTGPVNVTVINPAPGGGTSAALTFTIASSNNPAPTIASLTPSTLPVGSGPFTLTLTGTGFITYSQISFNGSPLTTTLNNDGSLSATVSSLPVVAGPVSVTVTNPAPGGGTSSAATFAVTNPSPVISAISPSTLPEGSGSFTVTVTGTGFVASSQIDFGGLLLTTTLQENGSLTATVSSLPNVTGVVQVTVVNPAPGGGTSPAATFTIGAASNPVPAITSISPSSGPIGSSSFTLSVTGTGFIATSQISFNGSLLVTTLNNDGTLSATIQSLPGVAGPLPVTVTNPTPGGGTSSAVNFTVTATNPLPAITSISPSTLPEGSGSFTLTVSGTGFISSSQIDFGGQLLTATLQGNGTLTATVSSLPDVTGTVQVTVINPTPGGGTSSAVNFTISSSTTNPSPVISSISPSTLPEGNGSFTLIVSGSGFVAASQVSFGGEQLGTTLQINGTLTATVPSLPNVTGTVLVTVINPPPGGGTSPSATFTIASSASNPSPVITNLSPAILAAGNGPFTLTVFGTGFVASSQITFNGVVLTTTLNGSTLLATVPSLPNTAGPISVTVTNPAPGGGTSPAFTFTVAASSNPVPVISSLSPSTIQVGASPFTLTVSGTGFIASSQITFNGVALATTLGNNGTLSATVSSVPAVAGAVSVTVTNPLPGGGTSAAASFSVTSGNNPLPAITALSPSSMPAGSGSFTLIVTGTGFVASSVVMLGGTALTTTLNNDGTLSAAVSSLPNVEGAIGVTVVNPSPAGGTSAPFTFTVGAVHTFASGLAMVSLPADYTSRTLSATFGITSPIIAIWAPAKYAYNEFTATDAAPEAGQGFWIRLATSTDVPITGTAVSTAAPYQIKLSPGWNMIGDPFPAEITNAQISVIDQSGASHTLAAAGTSGLVYTTVYGYNGQSNLYTPSTTLEPYVGYWIEALTACTLSIPAP